MQLKINNSSFNWNGSVFNNLSTATTKCLRAKLFLYVMCTVSLHFVFVPFKIFKTITNDSYIKQISFSLKGRWWNIKVNGYLCLLCSQRKTHPVSDCIDFKQKCIFLLFLCSEKSYATLIWSVVFILNSDFASVNYKGKNNMHFTVIRVLFKSSISSQHWQGLKFTSLQ